MIQFIFILNQLILNQQGNEISLFYHNHTWTTEFRGCWVWVSGVHPKLISSDTQKNFVLKKRHSIVCNRKKAYWWFSLYREYSVIGHSIIQQSRHSSLFFGTLTFVTPFYVYFIGHLKFRLSMSDTFFMKQLIYQPKK